MKKLMIAIEAEKPDQQSIAFGCYLARLSRSGLTGIFLENLPAELTPGVKFAYGSVFVETIDNRDLPETEFKNRASTESIRTFKTVCEAQGIACRVHRDQGIPAEELIAESRYADIIITGPMVFASSPLDKPAGLVKELLTKAECPVIVASYQSKPIDKILFAYDGNASSVFAIKQFTYLFPELKDAEITVLQADKDAAFSEGQKEKLYEYLKEHYSRINFKDLHGKPEDELFDYTLRQINACLVMGAFGRNWLSSLFKASTAEMVIKINNLPVFIAHR
ncbi:universal stress protein [Mucilaginibacter sp. BJC16-A38]|uniref:universal stress protein n=1 Tax=Mucilaginibacter phenanthrenivorans TaxID=1234842 RepID=UPI002157CA27|nr:universal stress protein [Mucilaginibacter phenanthrenivorans]MCR8557800.1 universal stress protein [Mucilaginibacter phenanthrenivorans]